MSPYERGEKGLSERRSCSATWAGSLSLVMGRSAIEGTSKWLTDAEISTNYFMTQEFSFSLELVWSPKPNTVSLTWLRAAQRSNNWVDCDILTTGWRAFRVCLAFSFEIRLACIKTAPASEPCSKERWQGNMLLGCIAALKQKIELIWRLLEQLW